MASLNATIAKIQREAARRLADGMTIKTATATYTNIRRMSKTGTTFIGVVAELRSTPGTIETRRIGELFQFNATSVVEIVAK
jgi:hypothetical protein